MFSYEFTSGDSCLITKIVISHCYLTLYTNKLSPPELVAIENKLNLEKLGRGFAEHPSHVYSHNPYLIFSAEGSSRPHQHFKFLPGTDRLEALKNIFKVLIRSQTKYSCRKREYKKLLKTLHAQRQIFGHKKFPASIEQSLNSYQKDLPYIAEKEIPEILHRFRKYLENDYYKSLEAIVDHAEQIMHDNFHILYTKNIRGAELSENEKILESYYKKLLNLRDIFLAIDYQPRNIELCWLAKENINELIRNPYYPKHSLFAQRIEHLNQFIDNHSVSIQSFPFWKTSFLASIMITGYFLYLRDSKEKLFPLFLLGSLAGVLTTFIHKLTRPCLFNMQKHLFFKYNNNTNTNTQALETPTYFHRMF